MRRWTLRTRLVIIVALLTSAVIVAATLASALALRGTLTSQLDARLAATAEISGERGQGGPGRGGPNRPEGAGRERLFTAGIERGTVQYLSSDGEVLGGVVSDTFTVVDLTGGQIEQLLTVPADGAAHTLALPELGDYRALAVERGESRQVTALPLSPVNEALTAYALRQGLIGLAGIALAAAAGAWIIRRELRPLQDVAATASRVAAAPMDRGTVTLERVDAADPSTEVGQVGAALNTMLGHVESSLAARHASETQVRQFVADASHELRTPLATISGYTELLRTRKVSPSEAETALARIAGESARMGSLVADMLLLARLDAGRELTRGEVDLAALAADAVLDAHAAGPDHRWDLEIPPGPGGEIDPEAWTVPGDEARLRQVLANLLTNARVHTPAGTRVTVRLAAEAGGVLLTVADDGPGIEPSLLGRVFDRFARGESGRAVARAEGSASSGLGLAIVKAIVDAHGGEISVESTAAGTAFTIRLPRA